MLEPSRTRRKADDTDNEADESLYRRPDVSLLDDSQWLYVQRHNRLSPRELQVAKHICRGCPNEEVAKFLSIRSGTVKTHLRNIYRRIHVTNKIGMLLTFVGQVAAFYDNDKIPHHITGVKNRQIEPDAESSDVPEKHDHSGLQS